MPVGEEAKYALPDEAHEVPSHEQTLGPAVTIRATCSDVGVSAASHEVGNYASAEERTPIETKYRARCRTLRLDQAERQCVFEAGDAMTIAYCAPRFFPEQAPPLVVVSECGAIANDIRGRSTALPAGQPGPDLWERQLAAIRRSCEQDRWPVAFGECARTQQVVGYIVPYCQHVGPAPLITRLEDRLAKVK